MPLTPLPPEALYQTCESEQLDFETTEQLPEVTDSIGLERALEAARFGLDIDQRGFNLFGLGPSGMGKRSVLSRLVESRAREEETPSDWCYVNCFELPDQPRALELPPGNGHQFKRDMERLVQELKATIAAVFESEEYQTRKQLILEKSKESREEVFSDLNQKAQERGLTLLRTPLGFAFAPVRDGQVISPDEFQKLSADEKETLGKAIEEMQAYLEPILGQVPKWEQDIREKVRELDREVTAYAVGHRIADLKKRYQDIPGVLQHLDGLEADVLDHTDQFLERQKAPTPQLPPGGESSFTRRYEVNLLVDHHQQQGAPFVYEDNPTYSNLVGRIEHMSMFGALLTDFTLIKPGALLLANGGYLLLDCAKVLIHPLAWEGLKRALRSRHVRIESPAQALSLIDTVSLKPEPIPLDVKVILVGDRVLYYLLSALDPEFNELFKVNVDFEEIADRNPATENLFARLIGTLARQRELRPLDRSAVGRVIEQAARLAGDAEKLSTHLTPLSDLLCEADYWARKEETPVIARSHVEKAVEAHISRSDRVRQRVLEQMERGTILVDTDGEKTGQVNGLAVVGLGQFFFGYPNRITARVRLGKGEVIDIEREVELGGPIHSKGVLILTGFLGARYATDQPLSLHASLVFEQSYSGVEGDSASSAELYALLSALSEIPIHQGLAVTGSVNQQGQVQAVGGVNQKIEGFFDLCSRRGLNGKQGVLIPAANAKHLMLRQDVVEAVRAGKFSIYPVETVDQGMEILTGLPAGSRGESGEFEEGTLNDRVEAKLKTFAKRLASSRPEQAGQGGSA